MHQPNRCHKKVHDGADPNEDLRSELVKRKIEFTKPNCLKPGYCSIAKK